MSLNFPQKVVSWSRKQVSLIVMFLGRFVIGSCISIRVIIPSLLGKDKEGNRPWRPIFSMLWEKQTVRENAIRYLVNGVVND